MCSDNCVECNDENTCTACEYGYFLLNTPTSKIICLPCPGYVQHADITTVGEEELNDTF
jgi:hypothetical protein